MKKVTKAVIPAAGFGTRLLPATKAVPKELLPIINVPTLQYIVQEAADAGIKELLLVVSKGKEAIKQHFSPARKLENELLTKNKLALLEEIRKVNKIIKISYVYQDKQLGLGHAIGCAKEFAKGEPIAVLLGDDVVVSNGKTALEQCIDAYNKTGCSVVGVQPVEMKVVNKYGIVSPTKKEQAKKTIFEINNLVEKPDQTIAPSNLAILGRYVLTPDIFKAIEKTPKDKSGEIQITNALKLLLMSKKVYACNFKGTRYDLGNKLGMVKATIDFALNDSELKDDVLKFIKGKK
ncbi:MAG: UTP--glucose-1-phosphate uridylyltransferase GalU [Mycoplasmoidaceae bacterium]|nr:UTP--glucose-1-phosphate uridylyltransferase GalU [Mycoplasmoidaceae bacterium]